MSDTNGAVPAGWHRDPYNPDGALRWWDGSRWTEHVQQVAATPFPQAGPQPYGAAGGYQPQPPWAGPNARGAFGGANQASLTAIGVAVLYVLIAVTTHFVLIGIVPLMASIRAVSRRERLAPLAVAAAVVALVVGVSAFAH